MKVTIFLLVWEGEAMIHSASIGPMQKISVWDGNMRLAKSGF